MAVVMATDGVGGALCGIIAAGLVMVVGAGVVKAIGTGWIDKVLPPVVTGCIIVVIGVGLSATAINSVMFDGGASETFDAVAVSSVSSRSSPPLSPPAGSRAS